MQLTLASRASKAIRIFLFVAMCCASKEKNQRTPTAIEKFNVVLIAFIPCVNPKKFSALFSITEVDGLVDIWSFKKKSQECKHS